MRVGGVILVTLFITTFVTLWAWAKTNLKVAIPSQRWVAHMANYCEDLADSFKRLESYHRELAKQHRQAKQKRLSELHEELAKEHERVSNSLDRLRKTYERLAKELRR
ncbi:MAG: hypothetical protein ACK40X_06555 [Armatimonadota bacterium]